MSIIFITSLKKFNLFGQARNLKEIHKLGYKLHPYLTALHFKESFGPMSVEISQISYNLPYELLLTNLSK